MPEWTIDIKQQKKGSGEIVYIGGYPPNDEAYIIFISKIHTIGVTRHGLSIQAGDTHSTRRFDMSESDRKAVLDFIIDEQRNNIPKNISKETNSRLQSIQELLSAQDKQITANQILLETLIKPTPKKSQTASILKHAGFA
jgi:hypothetical protein